MDYAVEIFPYVSAYIPSKTIEVESLEEGYKLLDEYQKDFVCADLIQNVDKNKPTFVYRNYPNVWDRREKDAAYAYHAKNPNWRDLVKV